jgi:hypothetical protein
VNVDLHRGGNSVAGRRGARHHRRMSRGRSLLLMLPAAVGAEPKRQAGVVTEASRTQQA